MKSARPYHDPELESIIQTIRVTDDNSVELHASIDSLVRYISNKKILIKYSILDIEGSDKWFFLNVDTCRSIRSFFINGKTGECAEYIKDMMLQKNIVIDFFTI